MTVPCVEAIASPAPPKSASPRRHDLDALRAAAMGLGILLHAAMSFLPGLWLPSDSQHSDLLGLFVLSVHGFRMPLFFLLSGYFTALLADRYGRRHLVTHRFRRILVPCLLGAATIAPMMRLIPLLPFPRSDLRAATVTTDPLLRVARDSSNTELQGWLDQGGDPETLDPVYGVSLLSWASLSGNTERMTLLLDRGASPSRANRDGSTALHSAAWLGRDRAVSLLLSRGVRSDLRDGAGKTAAESANAGLPESRALARLMGIKVPEEADWRRGRERSLASLESAGGATWVASGGRASLRDKYRSLLVDPSLSLRLPWRREPWHPITTSFFEHLWFLWMLWWLLPLALGFHWLVIHRPVEATSMGSRSVWGLVLWIAASLATQGTMGWLSPGFGPDTFSGLLPPPHVLLHYGVFLCAGMWLFRHPALFDRLGTRWWLCLLLAGVVFWPGVSTMAFPTISAPFQIAYCWLCIVGWIGAFRRYAGSGHPWVREVSDASYWMYIAHLPVVMVMQGLVAPVGLPAELKWFFIVVVSLSVLWWSWRTFVRGKWLGGLLGGPVPRHNG